MQQDFVALQWVGGEIDEIAGQFGKAVLGFADNVSDQTRLRLGGLVEKGSFVQGENAVYTFAVTDTIKNPKVSYKGQLPDLFREEQGVVAEGVLQADGTFVADTVLAKHDEKYMPKDVADKLKEKGVWQEGQTGQSASGAAGTSP